MDAPRYALPLLAMGCRPASSPRTGRDGRRGGWAPTPAATEDEGLLLPFAVLGRPLRPLPCLHLCRAPGPRLLHLRCGEACLGRLDFVARNRELIAAASRPRITGVGNADGEVDAGSLEDGRGRFDGVRATLDKGGGLWSGSHGACLRWFWQDRSRPPDRADVRRRTRSRGCMPSRPGAIGRTAPGGRRRPASPRRARGARFTDRGPRPPDTPVRWALVHPCPSSASASASCASMQTNPRCSELVVDEPGPEIPKDRMT